MMSAYGADNLSTDTINVDKPKSKVKFKFNADLEGRFMYDSYQSKISRNGVLYYFPLAPNFDPAGDDLNKDGELNFSVFSSKLKLNIDGIKFKKADVSSYFEVDFLGTSDATLQIVRMRHAYVKFKWEKDEFLLGQTSHLLTVDEVTSNTVLFGGGVPFGPLNRGVQARYIHSFASNMKFLFAAEMYGNHNSVGPTDAQAKASIPDLHAQMKFGSIDNVFGGFSVGAKFLQPRSVDNKGYKIGRVVPSYDISGFIRVNVSQYTLKLMGIYGQNLSMLGMIGGYGKLSEDSPNGNYRYANTSTLSSWFDFETPVFGSLSYGLFVGYMRNFGSNKSMSLSKNDDGSFEYGYFRDLDVKTIGRIAPRIYYKPVKFLTIGLEYSYFVARHGKTFDDQYRAVETYPLSKNSRVEVLTRFSF